jgi:hypothetical protein
MSEIRGMKVVSLLRHESKSSLKRDLDLCVRFGKLIRSSEGEAPERVPTLYFADIGFDCLRLFMNGHRAPYFAYEWDEGPIRLLIAYSSSGERFSMREMIRGAHKTSRIIAWYRRGRIRLFKSTY